MTDAILLIGDDGGLIFASREARERLGFADTDAGEHKSLRLLLGPQHPLLEFIEPALANRTQTHGAALRLSGRTCLVSTFTLEMDGGSVALLVLMRDLEQARALEPSGHLARLGDLLSGVTHQVRKPLNVMMLQLELLRTDAESGKPLTGRIERIRQEIHRLDLTIETLMRFMQPGQLKLQELDLNQLLHEIGREFHSATATIEYRLDPALPRIVADRKLLGEGLRNIIRNGLEAIGGEGVLKIRTAATDNDFVTVAVTDQGPGIAPENLNKIFNLYFTTKEHGTGLGLSLAARAIEIQGGAIDVTSQIGAGTTFTVSLPITRGPQTLSSDAHGH